jgi:aerobic carbon-monoxide dehydrogenase medium subunit
MKPPPFHYHAPHTLQDALAIVGEHDNTRLLAGGQSLMPMLNMRLLSPDHLVDINRIPELAGIREDRGGIVIGAMTRQRVIEFSPLIRERLPLLAEAITLVGHRQTRNRGTIGGSICHLDPSAEQPAVAMAMDATLTVASQRGVREIAMRDFALGLMTTALDDNEILTSIRIEPWRPGHGWAFIEYARRHGDFAIVSVAVLLELDAAAKVVRVALTLGGVCPVPLRLREAEKQLLGSALTSADVAKVAEQCAGIDALDDPQVPRWYRRRVAATLLPRAIAIAAERARARDVDS